VQGGLSVAELRAQMLLCLAAQWSGDWNSVCNGKSKGKSERVFENAQHCHSKKMCTE
jgi:hypothetical protein